MEWINEKAKTLQQGAIRAMFDRANGMTGVISLGIGEPDMATPALVCDAAKEALDKGITHYTPNAGTLDFRKAIAQKSYLKELHYDPASEIIVTNGGMGALSLLFLVLLNDGDEILIQDPQWLNYVAQVAYCGGTAVRVPTDAAHNFEMQPETIEALITPKTKALMINTPNNPTGSVMSAETMEKIAQLAVKHDLLVISDDVYNTLLYEGAQAPSIAGFPGMRERTVIVNSFSKSYAMTGWRIGFVAGPAAIVDRMTKCQENFNACANAPGQYAGAIALDHPELCEQLRQIFERRRSILLEGLAGIEGIKSNDPKGAFYVFADISSFGLSSEEFCNRLLDEQKVVCIPGSAFGACGEGFIRIAYTCSDEDLHEAIARIKAFCAAL
ncbi:MAG: pyridoxal phosphate-dependent aminotransferase [Oscillospiraceae bacterium]|nr:pyridoxal phosphate-dependent aminotransferase [Oscillospiraceae bacterium]